MFILADIFFKVELSFNIHCIS